MGTGDSSGIGKAGCFLLAVYGTMVALVAAGITLLVVWLCV